MSSNAVYLSGKEATQYQVSTTGPVPLNGVAKPLFGSAACSTALQNLVTAPSANVFENEYTRIGARSLSAGATLTTALAGGPTIATPFPPAGTNGLADQLKLVARMISTADAVGAKRQVFFVSMGGFDTHSGLATVHPGLLTSVAQALSAFYAATIELGVANQVTTFTASDFGRTLTASNGSDHGWGSMHFMLGGAVHGGRYYGTAPVVANNGPDDVGQGRLLPSTSCRRSIRRDDGFVAGHQPTPTCRRCCPTWATGTRASAISGSWKMSASRKACASPPSLKSPSSREILLSS